MQRLPRGYHLNTLLFLSPWLIIFILFQIYPIFYSFIISFTDLKAISLKPANFIAFNNYIKLILSGEFQDTFYNSLMFVLVSVPITMLLALAVALLLDRVSRFKTLFSFALFAPTVTSTFVIASLFLELYRDDGVFNSLLKHFNFPVIHWLKNPDLALYSIAVMNIWASFGFYSLVFLASIQTIPKDHFELARIEGANFWQEFVAIIWPHLRLTVLVMSLFNGILAFQIFGEIYIMTQGGPIDSTKTLVYYIYDTAFANQQLGLASAAAYIVFFFLAAILIIYFYLSNRKNKYD